MAGKKNKEDELEIFKEQDKIKELVKKYQREDSDKRKAAEKDTSSSFSLESREYEEFRSGVSRNEAQTLYEKLCRLSGKIFQIRQKPEAVEKLNETLYFIGSNVNASEVKSLGVVSLIFFFVFAGVFLALQQFSTFIFLLALGITAFLALPAYPYYVKRVSTMETLNSMPMMITYMVIFMRSSPTLEGAVRFTAQHMTGSIARDMKKLLWDFETGTYRNMDTAIKMYEGKWADKNRYFSQSLEIIRTSESSANEEKRLEMLDEAARIILDGNLSMMKDFARAMMMPIVALYMLSIVLPVMGLILAPMITSFMASSVSVKWLVAIYNIVLPLIIYGVTKSIMSKRPGAFQQPDITGIEGLPKPGRVTIKSGGRYLQIPLMPFALLFGTLIALPGLSLLLSGATAGKFTTWELIKSMTLIWGISAGIIIYTLGSSFQKLKMRKELANLEKDVPVFAYNIGSEADKGTPIEGSIRKIIASQREGSLKEFLKKTSDNITNLGMTLDAALFNPENGSLKFYPSTLLKTTMEIVLESAKKGLAVTANSLRSISGYLSNLKNVEESIKELIGSTISTMRFQAQFLNAFITGIIVSLNVLIFNVLTMLSEKTSTLTLESGGITGMGDILKNSMFNVSAAVPASHLQLIVGIYMIQTTVLMSILINGAERGKDEINKNHLIGKTLLMSTILYTLITIIGVLLFGSLDIGGNF